MATLRSVHDTSNCRPARRRGPAPLILTAYPPLTEVDRLGVALSPDMSVFVQQIPTAESPELAREWLLRPGDQGG